LNERKETGIIGIVIPKTMRKLIEKHVESDMHLNLSDFVRDAIREKLQREAPELYKQLFKDKENGLYA
jgi:Arc/MetJ-type ribon-helix-helix transcriptional regulator